MEEVVFSFALLENTGSVWAHLWPVSAVVVLIRLGHHRDSAHLITPPWASSTLLSLLSQSCPPNASLWMDGFLHLPPFIPQQWDVTQLCHGRISWRDPALNKTRQRTSACDGIQIALLPRSLLCYRCSVRNMHCTFRLLWAVIHPGFWFPLIIAAAHVGRLELVICS